MIEAYINWSLYVRTSNKRKLLEAHLPPINAALEHLDFDWHIFTEKENPRQFRLVTYQNIRCQTIDELLICVLRRAYRLREGWTIYGLSAFHHGAFRQLWGVWNLRRQSNKPPALDSVMFEAYPGQTSGRCDNGGWIVAGQDCSHFNVGEDA